MVIFFTIAALMVLAALAIVVPAMMGSRGITQSDRDQQNVLIARERLSELETQALAGRISDQDLEQSRLEIERALLDDLGDSVDQQAVANPKTSPGRWAGVLVAAVLPVAIGMLYLTLGAPGAVVSEADVIPARSPAPHPIPGQGDAPSVDEMVARLEERLKTTPDDANGWFTLATSYMALERFTEAAKALEKVRSLVGDNPDLLVRQADALAMAAGGVLEGEPEKLILRALAQNPAHPTGLWLAGIAASRRGDDAKALEYWRRAEPLFANNAQSQGELRQLIARAEQAIGESGAASPAPGAAPAGQPLATGPSLTVNVSLAEALVDQVSPEDTLFILARAIEGPPMPLAVSRRQVRELPLKVTLDDSMAMMPNLRLSRFNEVRVIARISKSGNAIAKSGDLFGEAVPVSTSGAGPVHIEIAQRVP